MKPCSLELRQQMLAAFQRDDHNIPEVGELFGVSTIFINKVLRLHHTGDDLAPRLHGGSNVPRPGA